MRVWVLFAAVAVVSVGGAEAVFAAVVIRHPVSDVIFEPVYIETAANGDLFVVSQDSSSVFRVRPSGPITEIANSADGLFLPSRLADDTPRATIPGVR